MPLTNSVVFYYDNIYNDSEVNYDITRLHKTGNRKAQ